MGDKPKSEITLFHIEAELGIDIFFQAFYFLVVLLMILINAVKYK
jgi:hypothetical protein